MLSNGEIRFNGDGSPAEGFNSHAFKLAPAGVEATQIVLQFGDPGSFAGTTNFSAGTESTLRLGSQDGFAAGALTEMKFDADGTVVASSRTAGPPAVRASRSRSSSRRRRSWRPRVPACSKTGPVSR